MTQFLYFVPTDRPTLSPKDLGDHPAGLRLGLGHLGLKADPLAKGCAGPGGKKGLVFAGDGSSAAYKPAEQEWVPGPDGRYYVGRLTSQPAPGPDELAKPRFVAGEPVEMGDQTWTVPVCRSVVRGATLPQALALGPDGKSWTFKRLPEFAALCVAAERLWSEWRGSVAAAERATEDAPAAGDGLPWDDVADYAVQAMGVNYRLGPVEVSMLGLLTTESAAAVCRAMIDVPALERVAAAQAAAAPGEGAAEKNDTPDT